MFAHISKREYKWPISFNNPIPCVSKLMLVQWILHWNLDLRVSPLAFLGLQTFSCGDVAITNQPIGAMSQEVNYHRALK